LSLPDGTNTPRQLSNLSGGITLSARYTPWGDTLDTYGTGDFTFGYFGGVEMTGSPFTLLAGASIRKSFPANPPTWQVCRMASACSQAGIPNDHS